MKTFPEIAAEYAPYDTLPEFQLGSQDYMDRRHDNPFGIEQGLKAQAWDRGAEAAMRFTRQHGGCR
jgi:hypothetical protein